MTTQAYQTLLGRLEQVRKYRPNDPEIYEAHRACCPAHDDKSPSLNLALKSDGKILIHCFSGCAAAEVLTSAGLEFKDAMSDRPVDGGGWRDPAGWWSFDVLTKRLADAHSKLCVAPTVDNLLAADELIGKVKQAARAAMRYREGGAR